jgi:hypothetical protein
LFGDDRGLSSLIMTSNRDRQNVQYHSSRPCWSSSGGVKHDLW